MIAEHPIADQVAQIEKENEQLKKELGVAQARLALLGEVEALMKARSEKTDVAYGPGVRPALPWNRREKRAALDQFLMEGGHLTHTNKQIARKFGMSKSYVATLISEAQKAGLVKRRQP